MIGPAGLLLLHALAAPQAEPGALADATGFKPRRIDVKAIEWTIPSEPVVLGETPRIEVSLKASRVDGSPLDVASPELWASTGSLSAPERTAAGAWKAIYTPPEDRFPHVAILSAQLETNDGPAVGFVSLPLWGKGRLKVQTKPESQVVVYLGNESFGPAPSGKAGLAEIDIIAPPGPERAVAESTDLAGNQSSKPVPLGVPSFSRLALMPIDDVAASDGTGEAQLLMFVVDKKGVPLFDATGVVLEADVGGFQGAPLGLAPGVFRIRYRPGETTAAQARVRVRIDDSKASQAEATIRLLSGRPVRAEVELDKTELSVDDDGTVMITARFFDKAGNPSPRGAARMSVDVGRLEAVEPLEEEGLRRPWVLPVQTGITEGTLTVRATTGEVLTEVKVTVKPGAPARLELAPIAPVVADGQSASDVVVQVRDRAGNPVSAEQLQVFSKGGLVVGKVVSGHTVTARFVPDDVAHEELVDVVARIGEVEVRQKVRVKPASKPLLSVGFGVRTDWNYGLQFASGPDLSILMRVPGVLDDSLHVGVNLGAMPSIPLPVTGRDDLWRFHLAMPLLAEGAWRPLLFSGVTLHVGGGVGATVGDLTLLPANGQVVQRSVFFAVGAQGSVGIAYRLGPGEMEVMARGGYFFPLGGRFLGTPSGVGLTAAYRIEL